MAMALPANAEEIIHDGLRYTVLEGTEVRVDGFAAGESKSALVIPEEITDGTATYTVVAVGDEAFRLAGLRSVHIPGSVRSIGREAFGFNMLMSECELPAGLESVGDYAFRRCFSAVLNLPSGIKHIGEGAFWECSKISEVTLPADAEIGKDAFMYCTGVTSLTLEGAPASAVDCSLSFNSLEQLTVKSLTPPAFSPEDVFAYGANENRNYEWTLELSDVTLKVPASAVDLYRTDRNWSIFTDIEGIQEDAVSEFEVSPFGYRVNADGSVSVKSYDGSELHATIPATVAYQGKEYTVSRIADNAFANSAIESVDIAGSVQEIGANAFIYCSSLTGVTLHEGVKTVGNKAFHSTGLAKITLPAGTEVVDEFAFSRCTGLKEVTLPEGVAVRSNAFNGCGLEKVTLGGDAELASGSMFSMSLRQIECLAEQVPDIYPADVWLFNGNDNFNDQVVLLVRDAAMAEAFKASAQWDMFKGILPQGTEYDADEPYLPENEIKTVEALNLSSGLKAFVPRKYTLQFLTGFENNSSIIVWDGDYGMRIADYSLFSASMQQWWDGFQRGDYLNGYLIGVNTASEYLVTSHSMRNATIMPDVTPLQLSGSEATEMLSNGRYRYEYCYVELPGVVTDGRFVTNDNVSFDFVDTDNQALGTAPAEGRATVKGILFNGAPEEESPSPRLIIIDADDYLTVGISGIEAESKPGEIYTLTGAAMGSDARVLQPGIYIRDGKKIVIR